MTELSVHAPEILWEDGDLLLYRAVPDGEALPVLAAMPSTAPPSREAIARLQHAYKLRDQLDPAWAARPLRLVTERGRLTLLSEDPGGEPLLRLMGHPWEIASFLRFAIGLAAALARFHERGLIQKDIKPANILVNKATWAVWLTGFGIASHLPRERQAPGSTEAIAGTLAYTAPEQTGRMNRSIDSRSDLYACGITLYETITGSLPFSASDPLEWIHCHIARAPTPPSERVYGIPGPIDAIILKLLAKSPEDRFQTAAGLEADLRACLTAWEAHRQIDPFPIGARDVPDWLVIPEKLYGRRAEVGALVAAFDRVAAQGRVEFILVSGNGGVGKSSLVSEFSKLDKARDKYKFVFEDTAHFDRAQGLSMTESALAGMKSPPDVIVCANDDMALGALVALKSWNLVGKVALIGFDALPEALGEVKAGNLTATIEQKPGGQSRRVVDILVAFLRDGEKPTEQVTQLAPVAITRNNVGEAESIGEVK